MAVATIAINFSSVNQVLQGTSTNTSINPAVLRTAFQANPSTLFLSLPSLTATYFGDGSNLTGNLLKSISGVSSFTGPSIVTTADTRVASISVITPFCPPWHVGKTGKVLYQENDLNRISQQITLSAEVIKINRIIGNTNFPMVGAETFTYLPTVPNTFVNGCLMADGRVFIAPGNGNYALIYNPYTNTYQTPGGFYAGGRAADYHNSAILMADGRIFCPPRQAFVSRIYDPSTDTISTPGGAGSIVSVQSYQFAGGVLMADGRIIFTPYSSTYTVIYNPVNDTYSTPSGFYARVNGSPGGHTRNPILLRDGRVLFASGRANIHIYEPTTNTLTTPNIPQMATTSYGSVLLRDGRVFCVPSRQIAAELVPGPYSGTMIAYIYDPYTNTYTTPSGLYPVTSDGNYTHKLGTLLPDGRVLCVPWVSTVARIYDPVLDRLTTPCGNFFSTSAGLEGAVNMRDGRVLMLPGFGGNPVIVGTFVSEPIPYSLLASGYFYNR